MKRIITGLFLLLFAAAGQAAEHPGHPSLWKVQGKTGVVYLLGSVHLLSADLAWRDARIDGAVAAAGAFYFETPLDPGAIQEIVAAKGTLPPGQSLRAMLPVESQSLLDSDLATIGLPEANIDRRRPWLAQIAMLGLQFQQAGLSMAGVDMAIMQEARARGKPLRYFETNAQQMALLVPDDPKLELESFERFLAEFKDEIKDIAPMMDAWAAGDQDKLRDLVLGDFDRYPKLRKAMLDDRNDAWVKTLESVLDGESGTVLVTVGAGHLAGDHGMPELLRRAGYTVTQL